MTKDTDLDDKAFIVTGAVTAPGRAIVAALAAAGANIAAVDDDQESLQALAVEVAGQGARGRVLAMAADLNWPGMCRKVVSRATLAFIEIDGLVIRAQRDEAATTAPVMAPPTMAPPVMAPPDDSQPFWDIAAEPPPEGNPPDVPLLLAATAARQFRARGSGRILVVTDEDVDTARQRQIAGWAADLENTGVTVNLLIAAPASASIVETVVRWLMSADSEGFSGQRLTVDAWDDTLPARETAQKAAQPLA